MDLSVLFSDDTRRDPFPLYRQLRSTAPVLPVPGSATWLVLDPDSVKRALVDHAAFSSRVVTPSGAPPDWLVFTDPPRHARLRGLVSRAFAPSAIAALEPTVRAVSAELLDALVPRGGFDLVTEYAEVLPFYVLAELLGFDRGAWPTFRRWGEAILGLSYTLVGGAEASARLARHAAVKQEMLDYVGAACRERRSAPRDDLLGRLVHAELDGERLTDADVLSFFELLLAAGTETTTNLIANAILCLLDQPEERARLRDAPQQLPVAVEEVLRYRPPVSIVFRQTRAEVELGGRVIPENQLVLLLIASANRDPAWFPDPDRFDAGRAPNPHLSFGQGIHFCIGAALARLEGRVAVGDLLERLPGLQRASEGPWAPRQALHVHGPASLPVRFVPGGPRKGPPPAVAR